MQRQILRWRSRPASKNVTENNRFPPTSKISLRYLQQLMQNASYVTIFVRKRQVNQIDIVE